MSTDLHAATTVYSAASMLPQVEGHLLRFHLASWSKEPKRFDCHVWVTSEVSRPWDVREVLELQTFRGALLSTTSFRANDRKNLGPSL